MHNELQSANWIYFVIQLDRVNHLVQRVIGTLPARVQILTDGAAEKQWILRDDADHTANGGDIHATDVDPIQPDLAFDILDQSWIGNSFQNDYNWLNSLT